MSHKQLYQTYGYKGEALFIFESLKLNQVSNCIVVNAGLSDRKTRAYIHVQTAGNIGGSSLNPQPEELSTSQIEVELEKGDDHEVIRKLEHVDIVLVPNNKQEMVNSMIRADR